MAHDQQRAGEPGQLVEQPALGRAVEMVGRLVEDEQLGLLEEHAHQVDPPALATRERLDVLEEELLAQAQPVGQAGHDRLGLVPPVLLELLLEVGEELDVLRRGVVGHAPAGIAQRIVEDVEAAGGEDVREPGGLEAQSAGHGGLGQIPEGAEQADVALVAQLEGGLPHQHRDEGRLAGPVPPDQAHLLARAHDEGGIRKKGAVADFDGESRSDDHAPLYGREVSPGYTPQNARTRPQMVDPDRRLHGDLHAAAGHHGRERGAAGHPALPQRELLGPAVGRGRLLADLGRLPPHGWRRRRHLRPAQDLRRRPGRLLTLVTGLWPVDHAAHAQPRPRRAGRRGRHHVRHVAGADRRRLHGQGPRALPSASTAQ